MKTIFSSADKIISKVNLVKFVFTDFFYCELSNELDLKTPADINKIFYFNDIISFLVVGENKQWAFESKLTRVFKHNGKNMITVKVNPLVEVVNENHTSTN